MLAMELSLQRWQQIDALFAAALEQPAAEREGFLESISDRKSVV